METSLKQFMDEYRISEFLDENGVKLFLFGCAIVGASLLMKLYRRWALIHGFTRVKPNMKGR
jgi:hypothetical protein